MIERNSRTRRRGAFSLIELLVVIAIIGVLVGLVAVAVFGFIGGQSKKNSELVLQKVHNALNQHWGEVIKAARKEAPPASVLTLAGGDATRAQVIWVKLRLKQEFPMSYAEALNPGGGVIPELRPIDTYVKRLNNGTLQNTGNPQAEMAACLLMALERPRSNFKFNGEETLGASALKDTNGDGVLEIVDGWGNPVGFYRWGTGNANLDQKCHSSNGGMLDRDTEDPDHTLMNANWNNSANPSAAAFQTLCHPIQDPQNGQPRSWFTNPVIVSAGKDGQLGLDAFMTPQGAAAADNIYSFDVKQ